MLRKLFTLFTLLCGFIAYPSANVRADTPHDYSCIGALPAQLAIDTQFSEFSGDNHTVNSKEIIADILGRLCAELTTGTGVFHNNQFIAKDGTYTEVDGTFAPRDGIVLASNGKVNQWWYAFHYGLREIADDPSSEMRAIWIAEHPLTPDQAYIFYMPLFGAGNGHANGGFVQTDIAVPYDIYNHLLDLIGYR